MLLRENSGKQIDGRTETKILEDLFDDKVNKAIDANRYQVREALKEIERNTRAFYLTNTEYHRRMMEEAKTKGDIATAIHHQVLMETYQGILKNFSLSESYDRA
ncbi:MAG: hypothetical protein QXX64_06350 [Nitrososphaera sp.]|uniref:Uncharacterized protein n=1 Tax=Nitrososphaera gargensis (strain Ga9.2) TaxID=1237085 RepID=K0INZ8_NITGG|nr:hypothetical protein [Candidatus Nitrososphaera gargensis]AFU60249.1 hypothetical protein Ngar_c33340 [Candidatus Nitrososphaera gargensis Ga9.2]